MVEQILSHFGLAAAPFEAPPDPAFLAVGSNNNEAWATLRFIVREGRNGCLLYGPAGGGKTIHAQAAVADAPEGSVICVDGLAPQEERLLADVVRAGRRRTEPLLNLITERPKVLVVDNAVDVAMPRWNELFYALNRLESAGDRCALLALVDSDRAGEIPALALDRLARRCLRRVELAPLSPDQVAHYLETRLARAGARRDQVITELAMRRIGSVSAGNPARINLICANAMLEAFSDDSSRVYAEHVDRAADALRASLIERPTASESAAPDPSTVAAGSAPDQSSEKSEDQATAPPLPIPNIRSNVASLRNSVATIAAVRRRVMSVDAAPGRDHRRSVRVRPARTTAIVQTTAGGGDQRLEYAFPTSLSREGAGVLAERRLETGAECRLWILDELGRPIARTARVARTRPLGLSAGLFEIGLEFDQPLPEGAVSSAESSRELVVA